MKVMSVIAAGALALGGLAACSSEKKIGLPSEQTAPDISIPDISIPDITVPAVGTLPPGVTIPDSDSDGDDDGNNQGSIPVNIPGLSQDCLKYAQALSLAFVGDSASFATLEEGFADLADVVPDDLQDDLEVLSEGYGLLGEKIAEHNNDYATAFQDPEVQALFSDQEFAAASNNFSTWLEKECGAGG